MEYSIRPYEEGMIEDQFKIGSKIYDPWPMGGQTRSEQLKHTYSQENFDPDTKFYAYYENEMIGFLTTAFKETKEGKIVYFYEFPYVKQEHRPLGERETKISAAKVRHCHHRLCLTVAR